MHSLTHSLTHMWWVADHSWGTHMYSRHLHVQRRVGLRVWVGVGWYQQSDVLQAGSSQTMAGVRRRKTGKYAVFATDFDDELDSSGPDGAKRKARTASADFRSPWVAFVDKHTKHVCYYNTVTEQQSWTQPEHFVWSEQKELVSTLKDPEGLGEDFETTPYVPPSKKVALLHRDNMVFRRGQSRVCSKENANQFAELGEAMVLYFHLLECLIGTFWILVIVGFPLVWANVSGTEVSDLLQQDNEPSLMSLLALFTIANAPIRSGNTTTLSILGRPMAAESGGGILVFVVSMCYLVLLVAWVAIELALNHRSSMLGQSGHASIISAREYTVEVNGLPPDATDTEIIDHFSKLYNLQEPDFQHRPMIWVDNHFTDPPTQEPLYPTSNVSNTQGDDRFMGEWVCDLSIANPIGSQLRSVFTHEDLVHQLRRKRGKYKYWLRRLHAVGRPNEEEAIEHRLTALWTQIQRLEEKLCRLGTHQNRRRRSLQNAHVDDVVCAFVTFNHRESVRRCLEDYRASNHVNMSFQPKRLQFLGEHPLHVRLAPDPSDIVWENLERKPWERQRGACWTGVLTVGLLLFSFLSVLLAFRTGNGLRREVSNPALCTIDLRKTFVSWVTLETIPDDVQASRIQKQDTPCQSTGDVNLQFKRRVFVEPAQCLTTNSTICFRTAQHGWTASRNMCPCFNTQQTDRGCMTYKGSSYSGNDVINCFCKDQVDQAIANRSTSQLRALSNSQTSVCSAFVKAYFGSRILILFSATSISMLNLVLEIIVKHVTALEYHNSLTKQSGNVMLKVFITLCINTAFILFFVNFDWPHLFGVRDTGRESTWWSLEWAVKGEHKGFDPKWYVNIGTTLTYTMLLDTFVPHLVPCLLGVKQFLVGKYKRSWGNIHIQRDLNEIFEYPPFELEIRLAYVTNTVAFTCLYFPTLPLLLPLAVISLTISSWVDHVMLLRFYSKPPAYSKEIIFMSMKYLPLIIFISVTWNLFMPLRDVFVHVFKTADPSVASVDLDQLWSLKLLFYAFCAIFLQDAVLHAVGVFIPYRVKQLVVTNLVHPKAMVGYVLHKACPRFTRTTKQERARQVENDYPFTENCIKKLSPEEEEAWKEDNRVVDGWNVCRYEDTAGLFRAVQWGSNGVSDVSGETVHTGDFKRTFEWIAEKHIHSYQIEHNPRYQNAVFALNLQRKRTDTLR